MIPTDLLDKLREKDPKTWKRAQSIRHFLKPHNSEAAVEAWLQHCIQDAIRAQGWWYELFGKSACVAIIGHGITCISERASQTEAEALLQAYLAALEATQAALREYLGREEDGQ